MQLQNETERAFKDRIRENESLIYKVCSVYADIEADREDLFQEIIIQLWKAYPNFKGNAAFSTWLYRVALNTAITGLRQRKTIIESVEPSKIPSEISDDHSHTHAEEQLHQLYHAVNQLGQIDKAIVLLYMEDRSYEEMEDILGMSQGNLRVKMNRIKEKLRQLTKNK